MFYSAEQADRFITTLAEFLVGRQVTKSIELEWGKTHAKEWAQLRSQTSLFGYPTIDEAKEILREDIINIAEGLKENK